MLVPGLQNVNYPACFQIRQDAMELFSAAVALEFINAQGGGKVLGAGVLNVVEQPQNGTHGHTLLFGNRGVGTAFPERGDRICD